MHCTVVEFEWTGSEDGDALAAATSSSPDALPAGCTTRIVGIDETGARVIELWNSPDDARAFGESAAARGAVSALPTPTRVWSFAVTGYTTAAADGVTGVA